MAGLAFAKGHQLQPGAGDQRTHEVAKSMELQRVAQKDNNKQQRQAQRKGQLTERATVGGNLSCSLEKR
jgi:hypothetical protein